MPARKATLKVAVVPLPGTMIEGVDVGTPVVALLLGRPVPVLEPEPEPEPEP